MYDTSMCKSVVLCVVDELYYVLYYVCNLNKGY